MKAVEDELLQYDFFRGNKGYLINLVHVEGVREGEAIVHGETLVLSRAKRTPFMEALTNYWSSVR
jgi:DNA-binding LytR/AlgR family response regulator